MLSLRAHNIIDYIAGSLLILSPAFFGFAGIGPASSLFIVLGFALVGYSLLTDYRYSLFKWIPLGIHMALDVALGVMLMLGPVLLGYRAAITDGQYALHFVYGLGMVALVVFTQPKARVIGARGARGEGFEEQPKKAA